MKIKIVKDVNWSEGEKEILMDVYSKMMDYYDGDEEESNVLRKLFECVELE